MTRRAAIFAALSVCAFADAHEGPHHVITALTERLAAEGVSARLLVRRADEHRVLGHDSLAIADYVAACTLEPENRSALRGLALTKLAAGRAAEALEHAETALDLTPTPDSAAVFHAIAARSHEALGDDSAALGSWQNALASPRPEVDWLLAHAATLGRLGESTAQRDALADARRRNPSVVIERAWIGALIETGDWDVAEPLIRARLNRARLKGSWLVLSARLHAARGDHGRARELANRAAAEFRSRLDPAISNPLLDAQLADANALLESIDTLEAKHP